MAETAISIRRDGAHLRAAVPARQWPRVRTRSDTFQFVNDEIVVAFGSQPGRHPPGSSAIAGVFDHPRRGRAQGAYAGIFPQPDARAGVDHAGREL